MKMTKYAPGMPCWVDLGTKDLDAAKGFYSSLFGWDAQATDDPAAGGYVMFLLGGEPVAGAMKTMSPEQPTVWSTYVAVASADDAMAKAESGGAKVIVAPMDVMDVGRMAMFQDPTGAALGLWQPQKHKGAGRVNEPGAMCWNELLTRDAAAAKKFYSAVFGWKPVSTPADGMEYTEWQLGGKDIGGLMQMDDEHYPPETPPNWNVYFAVADCAAAVTKIGDLGGKVVVPPTQIPVGIFAVCQDPQGAFFSIVQLKEEPGK